MVIVMVAFLGLWVDLGRNYVAKSELRNYANAAAFAAAMNVNGQQSGIDVAKQPRPPCPTGGTSSPKRWGRQPERSIRIYAERDSNSQ